MAPRKKRSKPMRADGRNDGEQWIPIGYRMAQSSAWRSLSGPAVKVWIELRSRYNGSNNGRLHLSMGEACRLVGIGKSTAQRAFQELEQKGFIVKVRPGYFYGRMATEYAVTDRPVNGHNATCDWKRWNSKTQRLNERPKQNRGPDTEHK